MDKLKKNSAKRIGNSLFRCILYSVVLLFAASMKIPGAVRNVPDGYASIMAAIAAASTGDTILIGDGRYRENVVVAVHSVLVTNDSGTVVTIDAGGSGSPVSVTADNVTVNGLRVTGGGSDGNGISIAGANGVIMNCISFYNAGDGFELNGTGALYNSNSFRNSTGISFSGGGTCINNISTENTRNFDFVAGVTQTENFSYAGSVSDIGYGGISGTNPLYGFIDSNTVNFLIPSSSSECVNSGSSLPGIVDKDIRGRRRPLAGAWDAGAYETNYGGVWLHHFGVVRQPADTIVGKPVQITVTAYSQINSVLTQYKENTLVTVLSAIEQDSVVLTGITDRGDGTGIIPGNLFEAGTVSFGITYAVAYDSVTVRITDPEDSSGISGSIMWIGQSEVDTALFSGIPDYLSIVQVPDSVVAGAAVSGISINAFKDTSGIGAPYVPVRFNADDYPEINTVWLVQGPLLSPYGYSCSVPSNRQNYPIGQTVMNGAFRFANAAPHRIQVCLVNTMTDDTLARSEWSDSIRVVAATPAGIKLRERTRDPYSWCDSINLSTDDIFRVYSGVYDTLGNFVSNVTASWVTSSGLQPAVPSGPDSSLLHRFSIVGDGYVTAMAGMFYPGSIFISVGSGHAVEYMMEVVVDPLASPGGLSSSSVGSDSNFQVRISAIDDGGNVARGYSAGSLQWRLNGQSDILLGATVLQDGFFPFTAGTAVVGDFMFKNSGSVALIVSDIDLVLHDTLLITVEDASGPELDSAVTCDRNHDGYIDGFRVFFNEPLIDNVAWYTDTLGLSGAVYDEVADAIIIEGAGGFSIEQRPNEIAVRRVVIPLNGGSGQLALYCDNAAVGMSSASGLSFGADTYANPDVQYLRSGGFLYDNRKNPAVPMTVRSTDGAPPAVTDVEYLGGTADNDFIRITFSEWIVGNSWLPFINDVPGVFQSYSVHGGSAVIGTMSQLINTNSVGTITILLGADAVAPVPGLDSLRLLPGIIADAYGNVAGSGGNHCIHDSASLLSGMRYGGYRENRNGFQMRSLPGGVEVIPGEGWSGNPVTLSAYSAEGELIARWHEFDSSVIFKPNSSGVYFFECMTDHGTTVRNALILRN